MFGKKFRIGLAGAIVAGLFLSLAINASARTRHFAGAINKKLKIHMRLDIQGNNVSGAYYYDKYKTDIQLSGSIDNNRNISLTEYDPNGRITGNFVGKFVSDGRIEGKWIKPDGSKSLPFYVAESSGSGPGAGPGGSGKRDSRFVGTWFYRITDIGGALTVRSDGTFKDEWDNNTSKGTWTSSGNSINLRYSDGASSTATLNPDYGGCLELESGHPACK